MNASKLLGYLGIVLMLVFSIAATNNFVTDSFNTDNYNSKSAGNPGIYNGNGKVQEVYLTAQNFNYYPDVLNLKYNVPTRIIVDATKVRGCLKSIVIRDFGVRKYITPEDNVIEFLPDKRGEFGFSCSMGMAYGKIIVT